MVCKIIGLKNFEIEELIDHGLIKKAIPRSAVYLTFLVAPGEQRLRLKRHDCLSNEKPMKSISSSVLKPIIQINRCPDKALFRSIQYIPPIMAKLFKEALRQSRSDIS